MHMIWTLLPLAYSLLCTHIIFSIFLLLLPSFCNKILFFYISVQYDICNSILYVINYVYPQFPHTDLLFTLFLAVGGPQFYYSEKEFLLLPQRQKAFLNHSSNAWFSLYNKNHRLNRWFILPLEGGLLPEVLWKSAKRSISSTAAFGGYFYLFTFSPINELIYSLKLIWSAIQSSFHWSFTYFFVFLLTVSTTKTFYFHICILNLHVYQN